MLYQPDIPTHKSDEAYSFSLPSSISPNFQPYLLSRFPDGEIDNEKVGDFGMFALRFLAGLSH